MSDTNMDLWNKVKVTDPSAVKPITGKSYRGNSPKPYWIIQRATEVFGPVGIGWGVVVKSERFERLGPTDFLHVAVVSVWYVLDGKRSETFDQMGGTKAAYMTNSGKLMVDEDAGKKSVTDGMVKCLSMIGFAGDIFSGQWDDSKYVEWAEQETARRQGEAPVIGAAQGIGDDLPDDWKLYLKDTMAPEITEMVNLGNVTGARERIAAEKLEADQHAFMFRHLSSTVRSALKKAQP